MAPGPEGVSGLVFLQVPTPIGWAMDLVFDLTASIAANFKIESGDEEA